MAGWRIPLDLDVLTAARLRLEWIFDQCPRISVSFSGGKDSSVLLHLAAEIARRRGRRIGCLFIDLEAQYELTIEHVEAMFALYADVIDPYWVALPMSLRNACSVFEQKWTCWDPNAEPQWIRKPPKMAITDPSRWDWFYSGMEFEVFVDLFGEWYSGDQMGASLVGIRCDESLNRWRTIVNRGKSMLERRHWTTKKPGNCYSAFPIYDWRTRDIWIYNQKSKASYNRLYDRMHQAGLTIHQQRICQPYGDDQKRGLWLYQIIEPKTWGRVLARVAGANSGALYSRESGNITGMMKVTLPDGHTWESFAKLILSTMPAKAREHYQTKISVFLEWHHARGYSDEIPDYASAKEESSRETPSWRRIAKTLLRNDYWCKGLSFSQHKDSESYRRYIRVKKSVRRRWGM